MQLLVDCSQFLRSSKYPLYKAFPTYYPDIKKVKVRQKKRTDPIKDALSNAFKHKTKEIGKKAVFTCTDPDKCEIADGMELFYAIPISGYKFLYNEQVSGTSLRHQQVFNDVLSSVKDECTTKQLLAEVFNYSYKDDSLEEACESKSDVILYNVPYFYAVRCSKHPYDELINKFLNNDSAR